MEPSVAKSLWAMNWFNTKISLDHHSPHHDQNHRWEGVSKTKELTFYHPPSLTTPTIIVDQKGRGEQKLNPNQSFQAEHLFWMFSFSIWNCNCKKTIFMLLGEWFVIETHNTTNEFSVTEANRKFWGYNSVSHLCSLLPYSRVSPPTNNAVQLQSSSLSFSQRFSARPTNWFLQQNFLLVWS